MQITVEQLQAACPKTRVARLEQFVEPINATIVKNDIGSCKRLPMFLAEITHESECFIFMEEIASGSAYEGRKDLGNVNPGDGKRFKGRGLIQLTGRSNYERYAEDRQLSLDSAIQYLETPEGATDVAGWFWDKHHLNEAADADDFLKVSVLINGRNRSTGLPNGWQRRQDLWQTYKEVLGC